MFPWHELCIYACTMEQKALPTMSLWLLAGTIALASACGDSIGVSPGGGSPGPGGGSPGTNGDAMPPSDGGPPDAARADVAPPGPDAAPTPDAGCDVPPPPSQLIGWATEMGGTTGGEGGSTVIVTTLAELTAAARGTTPTLIQVQGTISGSVSIGSNKTIVGVCGASFVGHLGLNRSANVIVRNLTIVGFNCTDNPNDCSGGADAITVQGQSQHLWFDHDDISDGSDGNLDITHGSDFITISWTKFHYSGRRVDPAGASGGHQFSNLIGHSDNNAAEDTGHLTITFHHDWWADNVVERMPRVRFGQVHLFNNLYTAAANDYCIGVGVGANIRDENNVFVGVKNPIDSTSFSDAQSTIQSIGPLYENITGTTQDIGGAAFQPPYGYTLEPTSAIAAEIMAGAGPR